MNTSRLNEYAAAEHALKYLARADRIPHRTEGEAALLELPPPKIGRVLDWGTGDGRLLALVQLAHPETQAVALDFSSTMLDAARKRFRGKTNVRVVRQNLEAPLPELGRFDAISGNGSDWRCSTEQSNDEAHDLSRLRPAATARCAGTVGAGRLVAPVVARKGTIPVNSAPTTVAVPGWTPLTTPASPSTRTRSVSAPS